MGLAQEKGGENAKTLNIKPLRESRNLKKIELADRIKVTCAYICQLEKGERNPSMSVLLRLSDELECSIDDLFQEDGQIA